MTDVQTIVLDGTEYVVLPKSEYVRLQEGLPPGTVEAKAFMRMTIASDLRKARETAGLSQPELAKKLGKAPSMVSGVEQGRISVGEKYIAKVLKVCGLPKDWSANAGPARVAKTR